MLLAHVVVELTVLLPAAAAATSTAVVRTSMGVAVVLKLVTTFNFKQQ
jgi:hypothetical protein